MKSQVNKISTSAYSLLQGAQDSLVNNIVTCIKNDQIKFNGINAEQFITLIKSSINEGYCKGAKVFEREVDGILIEMQKQQDKKK